MAVAAGVDTWEIVVDVVFDDSKPLEEGLREYVGPELEFEVLQERGPGGGWPEVAVRGAREDVEAFARKHYEDDARDDEGWISDQLTLIA